MALRGLKRELRIVEELIAALSPDVGFAEDLVCLEMNRKALSAALSIERAERRKSKPSRFRAEMGTEKSDDVGLAKAG
jgi:hypothetical protein